MQVLHLRPIIGNGKIRRGGIHGSLIIPFSGKSEPACPITPIFSFIKTPADLSWCRLKPPILPFCGTEFKVGVFV